MRDKVVPVLIDVIFPRSHLERYLSSCSQIEFDSLLTPRPQRQARMFHPFRYKDAAVKDCVIELKERNNQDVAWLFSKVLAQWIMRKVVELDANCPIYLVPVPQHLSKTREKGFCHATTLTRHITRNVKRSKPEIRLSVFPCVSKITKTMRLHDSKGRSTRFKTIKNTMRAFVTKRDAETALFFVIDDVFTTGATFKEVRRSLSDCGVPDEHLFFVSIAH